MSIITRITGAIKARGDGRLPMGGGNLLGAAIGGNQQGTPQQQINSLPTVGWLFSVVDRIASATAATEWQLFQPSPDGSRAEVADNPLLNLWNNPNPYYTQEEFVEASQQFYELTGEIFWVLLRNNLGMVEEMWTVNPTLMTPIPHPQEFVAGYVYRLGSSTVILDPKDVLFVRRPNPSSPYRGIGTVESIWPDLQVERNSAQWARNFFQNSAMPGGLIETEDQLSDPDFERLVTRWREQHQGVANAHRVAVLEKAKWVDRKLTQRDMQFDAGRRLNRDIIIGSFGVPLAVMGIAEDINRANAEAADVTFSKYVLKPRLRRMRDVLNHRLAPMFVPDGLLFDFVDPTPEDRLLNLDEAERGWNSGLLTKNEGRARLGEGAVADGDTFKAPAASPFALTIPQQPQRQPMAIKASSDPGDLRPDDVTSEQDTIEGAWAKRLKAEGAGLAKYLGEL